MGPALLVLLLLLIFPFLVFVVGAGALLFVKPQGIRPPWWDWGMDDPKPVVKVEAEPEVEIVPIEESPEVAAPVKPGSPRW